jgi:hypothetical protein
MRPLRLMVGVILTRNGNQVGDPRAGFADSLQ